MSKVIQPLEQIWNNTLGKMKQRCAKNAGACSAPCWNEGPGGLIPVFFEYVVPSAAKYCLKLTRLACGVGLRQESVRFLIFELLNPNR